ncbi:MAG: hypothetical protein ACRDSP_05550 [Pseudonocardiaceae bacterium]
MSWQDQVRQLDEELAAGRLSADEHQRRRAEVTEQGGGNQGNAGDQDSVPTDRTGPSQNRPVNQPTGAQNSPFPPAFRWESTPPNETTQVIEPISGGDPEPAERTQVIRTPDQPPPGPSYEDSERTQVVQAGPPLPPPYGQPSYPQQQYPGPPSRPEWTQQESAPPWMSSDLPPIQEPDAGWMMQGPEHFEPEKKDPGTMRIVAIVVTVVVLLGIGIGAFFLFRPSNSNTAAGTIATQQPPAARQPPAATSQPPSTAPPQGLPITKLPGRQLNTSMLQEFGQLAQADTFTKDELGTLAAAGPSHAALALSTDNGNKLVVVVVQEHDPAAARDGLAELQSTFDLTKISGVPDGVLAAGTTTGTGQFPVLQRAHYASGDYVVRVEASGKDTIEVGTLFRQILDAQLKKLPADG